MEKAGKSEEYQLSHVSQMVRVSRAKRDHSPTVRMQVRLKMGD